MNPKHSYIGRAYKFEQFLLKIKRKCNPFMLKGKLSQSWRYMNTLNDVEGQILCRQLNSRFIYHSTSVSDSKSVTKSKLAFLHYVC